MANTRDLVLQAYTAELSRLRALSPPLLASELEETSPLWAPVTVSTSTAWPFGSTPQP
jgi:hypothetical protein